MSREAFIKAWCERTGHLPDSIREWWDDPTTTPAEQAYINDCWNLWQAATEAAEPKWIPYKEGDVVEEGSYLVTALNHPNYSAQSKYGASVLKASAFNNIWFDDVGGNVIIKFVTAYRPLPAPYGGDA